MENSSSDTTRFVTIDTYAENRSVEGRIVTVLDSSHENRGLNLILSYSRTLPRYSIHELIMTDEKDLLPGQTVQKIAYLGFFEVWQGGCVIIGEELNIGEKLIGKVLGFDITHEPNHLNIIIAGDKRQTGKEWGFHLETPVRFELNKTSPT